MSEQKTSVLACPIRTVTVLEDRAIVERRANFTLPKGTTHFRIDGASPVIVDKTLVPTIKGVAVIDLRVHRTTLMRDRDQHPEYKALLVMRDEKQRDTDALNRAAKAAEEDARLLQASIAVLSTEVAEDVAWGQSHSETWAAKFEQLHQDLQAAQENAVVAAVQGEEAAEALSDIESRLREMGRVRGSTRASIELIVFAKEETECDVHLAYVVPNACWRPRHRASKRDGTVRFETDASVWQNTGVDWTGVELFVSTERASLGVQPPTLDTDWLQVRKKGAGVQVQMRQEEVEKAGSAGGAGNTGPSEMPGIDDGGEAWLVPSKRPATVATGGHAHRIPLSAFEADAESSLILSAELELAVVRKVTLVNDSARPILAGPVDLIADSGPVGVTKVAFVAPGETFDLSFGAEPSLRVCRTARQEKEKNALLSSWHRTTHTVDLKISNLGSERHHLKVTERVPVSEIAQVEIEIDENETTGGKKADRDGFVQWLETLEPRGRATLRLRYVVSRKGDVAGL